MNPSLKEKLTACQETIEAAIDALLPPVTDRPSVLHTAMRYSMKVGGKRIRPVLLIAASELFQSETDPVPAAVAIECLHTYSLIHDDLPTIDNSDLRRGQPSCHVQFNEATALLTGDALLTFAFQILSKEYAEQPEMACTLIQELAYAAGSKRLIGGQMEDIESEGNPVEAPALRFIHENKTGALLTAALRMGLHLCGPSEDQLKQIRTVGEHLGIAFQIVDDILDVTSRPEKTGKPAGQDAINGKSTYVTLYGVQEARIQVQKHSAEAMDTLKKLGGNNALLLELFHELEGRIY